MTLVDRLRDPDHKYLTSDDDDYADLHHAAANRIAALQEALRDVLDCVWSGSSADRKFWRDEAVATFERAAALAQDDTAKDGER